MNIKLDRPLCILDFETTGLSINSDRAIEVYVKKLQIDYYDQIKKIGENAYNDKNSFYYRINPEKAIAEPAQLKHGIKDEDLLNCPTFKDISQKLLEFITDCDLCGYNLIEFDLPLLLAEFARCGINYNYKKAKILDPKVIYWKKEPRTLSGTYKTFIGKELENAHCAIDDVNATQEIMEAMLDKYQDTMNNDIEEIHKFIFDGLIDLSGKFKKLENGSIVLTFGKHRDKNIFDVYKEDPKYFDWMAGSDMSLDTKIVAKQLGEYLKQKYIKENSK